MEDRLDKYQHEALLDSLVLVGVKQAPGVDLKVTMHSIIQGKMSLSAFLSDQILSVQRYRLLNPTAQNTDKVELPLCASNFLTKTLHCI